MDKKTPFKSGFRLPPEWVPQSAVWLSWPSNTALWPGRFDRIPPFFAHLASAISRFVEVRINAAAALHAEIRKLLAAARANESRVKLFDHPVNDVWCRDHGPLFVKNSATGEIAVTDWGFNAWGGKFEPWNLDDAIPAQVVKSHGMRHFPFDIILEGGAIEINGMGVLLTTEEVLLNPNRNPGITKDDYARLLRDGLGAEEIIWLGKGMPNDDTDGHIDNITRFFRDDAVLAVVPPSAMHPAAPALNDNLARLRAWRSRKGQKLDIVELPTPWPPVEVDGRELPASHANYLVTNGAVIMPAFNRPTDKTAAKIIATCFPGREIIPLDCTDVLLEGGAIHCLTQQQPA